jgi:uroporphyrin-III C-methyltransferase/precorrin-2 dehydrogenase/sirohydrochlorin ferrochelatase
VEYLPLFARLAGRPVLVVGGGAVALRKVHLLQRAGAQVTVNAPQICPALTALAATTDLRLIEGEFAPDLVTAAVLVIAATDDPAVNAQVFAAGERHGRWVNSVDDPEHSSFITPAIVDRSPLVIAISSGGTAPALARQVRTWLEARLPETLGSLFGLAEQARSRIVAQFPDLRRRRRFYEWLMDRSSVAAALDQGHPERAEACLQQVLAAAEGSIPASGRVVLVGAGPGDPALLTLRALRHLECADSILYDRLVTPEILERARRDAVRVEVGKGPGRQGWTQELILGELARRAAAGEYVVRLKGGDPFIFGRGGEEIEYLQARGVAVEVVPGITAALGCAAAAGIPLTHRDDSHGVCLIAAVGLEPEDDLDLERLAPAGRTVVAYMGVQAAPRLQAALLAAGHAALTPAVVIENGTTPRQRVFFCRVADLAATVRCRQVEAPALVIVGPVVARAPGYAAAASITAA